MPPKNVHTKKAAAMEKKAANANEKALVKQAQMEAQEASAWNDGADLKSAKRRDEQEKKAQERDAKRAEKAALENEEAALAASIKAKPKKVPNAKQAAKNNELKELEAQLRAMETEKKKKEEKKKAASGGGKKGKKGKAGSSEDESSEDEGLPPLEANPNRGMAGVEIARNLDQAIDLLGSGGAAAGGDSHPEKKQKAAHKAFEERMLVELKESMPGMRMSQYKDRIFEMWKKSPENPMVAARAVTAGLDLGGGKKG
eukprot:evm.model.NODE_4484_length_14521_cov_34.797466.2